MGKSKPVLIVSEAARVGSRASEAGWKPSWNRNLKTFEGKKDEVVLRCRNESIS